MAGVRRRRRSTSLILEVGLGGRLDAVNVFDADCRDRHQRRPRPHGLPGRRPASRSASRRPASSAPASRPSCADPHPPQRPARSCRGRSAPTCGCCGRDFGFDRRAEAQWRYWRAARRARSCAAALAHAGAARRQPAAQRRRPRWRRWTRCATGCR
ncbi:MAG: hypothetical protein MZW92_79590 [Comamonadaceae bacterium]|nr:hypothetical protein [Comamonadaceae bacterium]